MSRYDTSQTIILFKPIHTLVLDFVNSELHTRYWKM
uniref:Uncharacterized protein n=1 Tax=Anguilla anguilla TaxID=7936 RepID=A0A0E9TGN4_ANGAN